MTDVVTLDAQSQVVIPKPEDYVKQLRGLHKEVWEEIDTEQYLYEERNSWNLTCLDSVLDPEL